MNQATPSPVLPRFELPPSSPRTGLPLGLGGFDHYTLIVPDAAASARYHIDVLGFRLDRIQPLNVGSAPEGAFDMLNYVMALPDDPGRVMVITEGLTDASIFRRYLVRFGAGVHHIAYSVQDIDQSFQRLRAAGIPTTSEQVLNDPLSGLRQVFLDREGPGYFIELIERTESAQSGQFVDTNMARLARTMTRYLGDPQEGAALRTRVSQVIQCDREEVIDFLAHPGNLPRWTCHQTVRNLGGRWIEIRQAGDVQIEIGVHRAEGRLTFRWRREEQVRAFECSVIGHPGGCLVEIDLSDVPDSRRGSTTALLEAELRVLAAELEGQPSRPGLAPLRAQIDRAHLDVYRRRGL